MTTRNDSFSPEGALEHGVHEGGPQSNRLVTVLLVAAISASALSVLFSIGTAVLSANQGDQPEPASSRIQQNTPERTLGTVGLPPHDAQGGQLVALTHTVGALNPAQIG